MGRGSGLLQKLESVAAAFPLFGADGAGDTLDRLSAEHVSPAPVVEPCLQLQRWSQQDCEGWAGPVALTAPTAP